MSPFHYKKEGIIITIIISLLFHGWGFFMVMIIVVLLGCFTRAPFASMFCHVLLHFYYFKTHFSYHLHFRIGSFLYIHTVIKLFKTTTYGFKIKNAFSGLYCLHMLNHIWSSFYVLCFMFFVVQVTILSWNLSHFFSLMQEKPRARQDSACFMVFHTFEITTFGFSTILIILFTHS